MTRTNSSRSLMARIGVSTVGVFFALGIFAPTTAFAATLEDLAMQYLQQASQTTINTLISSDPDLQAFFDNPTIQNFSLLDSTTISTILNDPSVSSIIPTLSGDIVSLFSENQLIETFQNLTTTALRSFSSTFFSVIPEGTISSFISGVSPGTLTSLATSLLTGQTSIQLNTILSVLSPEILGSIPTSITSLISPDIMSNLLSGDFSLGGLSSGIISSLGGSLLGGFSSGNLTSMFNTMGASGILSGALSTAAGSLLSTVGSSVLGSAVTGVVGGLAGPIGSALTSVIPSSMLGSITGFTGFGLFVPVFDVALVPAFMSYSSAFNAYASNMNGIIAANPDSLRNIIAGGNPPMDECHTRDANDKVWAYSSGPWAWAYASATPGDLPATIPEGGQIGSPGPDYVQVIGQGQGGDNGQGNDSGSLRCILTALVGYQKIALYVQIQSLLKEYISNAQQQELSNKLLNQINAANLNWAKQGERVVSGGIETTESVYVQNSDQSQYARNARTAETIVAQAAAQEGDAIGSLELCNPLETATVVAINLRDDTEDPRNFVTESTKCSLLSTDGGPFTGSDPNAAFDNYMQDANTPDGQGAVDTFRHMLNNAQDTKIGAAVEVSAEAGRRLAQDEKRYAEARANSGFQPTIKCSGLPGDPYCDPAYTTEVTAADVNKQIVADEAIPSGMRAIENYDVADDVSDDSAENLVAEAVTAEGGVAGYDTTGLASSQTGVNKLIQELYDTIQVAYFDLNPDQEEWASAALLNIYDVMKFDDQTPRIGIPSTDADAPTATEYIDF
ncbi:MAG: hypothetical protein Q7S52_03080 [bacterium]|nr:hypothetical protein [bacterium]